VPLFMKKEIIIYLMRDGIKPIIKGQTIMRNLGNVSYPIAYLKKAKNASEKEYWSVLDYLFPKNR